MEEKSNRVYRNLIIDGSFFMHLYTLTLNPLYNSEFQDISITYYFLNRLYNIIELYKPFERVFVVLDIGRDLKKKQKYELYKANRLISKTSNFTKNTLNDEQYNRLAFNRKLIYEILKTTPIFVFAVPYVEGDTILAFIKKYLDEEIHQRFQKIEDKFPLEKDLEIKNSLIITADKDFVQYVDENTDLLLMNTINRNTLYTFEEDLLKLWILVFFSKSDVQSINFFNNLISGTLKEFRDKFENNEQLKNKLIISLRNLPYYRSFLGDSSDNIAGLKGFGNVLVSSMIIFHQYKHIENILKNQDNKTLYKFNSTKDFLDFWNTHIEEFETFVKHKLKRKRVNVRRLKQFLRNEQEIQLWKTFFELMDFDYAIENIPVLVKREIYEELDIFNEKYKKSLNQNNEFFYNQKLFLEYIYEFELNSENDYIKWNLINKILELNLKDLIRTYGTPENLYINNWNKYLNLLEQNKIFSQFRNLQHNLLKLVGNSKLRELFIV
jgi:5'-3' exonuclease